MALGVVKWFNVEKGYGFIAPQYGSKDIFVHITAVHQSGLDGLVEGQELEFEITQGADGRASAVGIRQPE